MLRDIDDSATRCKVVAIWLGTTTQQFASRNPGAQLRNVGMFDRRRAQICERPTAASARTREPHAGLRGRSFVAQRTLSAPPRNARRDTAMALDAIAEGAGVALRAAAASGAPIWNVMTEPWLGSSEKRNFTALENRTRALHHRTSARCCQPVRCSQCQPASASMKIHIVRAMYRCTTCRVLGAHREYLPAGVAIQRRRVEYTLVSRWP